MPPSQIHRRWSNHQPGRRKRIIVLLAAIVCGGLRMLAAETRSAGAGAEPSNDPARQLFAAHCQKCHSGPKHKGDFQIESLTEDYSNRKNREQWLAVREQLVSGDMPPKEKPRPSAQEVQ